MDILESIRDKKANILDAWFRAVIESYPQEAGKYFLEHSRQFTNPVGFTIHDALDKIFKGMFEEAETELKVGIEEIIRLRAVQDFCPSEAVAFMQQLKPIVLQNVPGLRSADDQYLFIENIIDKALLMAFDIYMNSRERIFEIKATEVRNRTSRMIERLSRKYDLLDDNINN
jgi:hypothetical protein